LVLPCQFYSNPSSKLPQYKAMIGRVIPDP
jgi:hypothetical protein